MLLVPVTHLLTENTGDDAGGDLQTHKYRRIVHDLGHFHWQPQRMQLMFCLLRIPIEAGSLQLHRLCVRK